MTVACIVIRPWGRKEGLGEEEYYYKNMCQHISELQAIVVYEVALLVLYSSFSFTLSIARYVIWQYF